MPKAAFQFGVEMQDGRKTRKLNKDQKLTDESHKINKILARKKAGRGGCDGHDDDGGGRDTVMTRMMCSMGRSFGFEEEEQSVRFLL